MKKNYVMLFEDFKEFRLNEEAGNTEAGGTESTSKEKPAVNVNHVFKSLLQPITKEKYFNVLVNMTGEDLVNSKQHLTLIRDFLVGLKSTGIELTESSENTDVKNFKLGFNVAFKKEDSSENVFTRKNSIVLNLKPEKVKTLKNIFDIQVDTIIANGSKLDGIDKSLRNIALVGLIDSNGKIETPPHQEIDQSANSSYKFYIEYSTKKGQETVEVKNILASWDSDFAVTERVKKTYEKLKPEITKSLAGLDSAKLDEVLKLSDKVKEVLKDGIAALGKTKTEQPKLASDEE